MATWRRFGGLAAGAAFCAATVACASMRSVPPEAVGEAVGAGIGFALDRLPDHPPKPSNDLLQFDPPIVTFGVPTSRGPMPRTVVAKNVSDRVVHVASATVTGSRFTLVEPVATDALFPGDSFEFQIRCAQSSATSRGKVTFTFE